MTSGLEKHASYTSGLGWVGLGGGKEKILNRAEKEQDKRRENMVLNREICSG